MPSNCSWNGQYKHMFKYRLLLVTLVLYRIHTIYGFYSWAPAEQPSLRPYFVAKMLAETKRTAAETAAAWTWCPATRAARRWTARPAARPPPSKTCVSIGPAAICAVPRLSATNTSLILISWGWPAGRRTGSATSSCRWACWRSPETVCCVGRWPFPFRAADYLCWMCGLARSFVLLDRCQRLPRCPSCHSSSRICLKRKWSVVHGHGKRLGTIRLGFRHKWMYMLIRSRLLIR